MYEEDIRKNKRTKVINEIIKTKTNKKYQSQILKNYLTFIYCLTIMKLFFKKEKNTQFRKQLLKCFQNEYLLYPKKVSLKYFDFFK